MTRVRLCFHDRCFDGTASAALFYRFYREKFDAKAEFGFTGMTHKAKQPWEPGLFDGDENATGAGRGVIHLDVTGTDGFHATREAAITIRPARGVVTAVAGRELAPGAQAALAVSPAAYIPGTWTATATFGAPVRYDAEALVKALADYPL